MIASTVSPTATDALALVIGQLRERNAALRLAPEIDERGLLAEADDLHRHPVADLGGLGPFVLVAIGLLLLESVEQGSEVLPGIGLCRVRHRRLSSGLPGGSPRFRAVQGYGPGRGRGKGGLRARKLVTVTNFLAFAKDLRVSQAGIRLGSKKRDDSNRAHRGPGGSAPRHPKGCEADEGLLLRRRLRALP